MEMDKLIQEGASLKTKIAEMQTALKAINSTLAENAEYKNGCQTATIIGGGYSVKVSKKTSFKYDQQKVAEILGYFPQYEDCFKTERQPIKKAIDYTMANDIEFAKAVSWARKLSEGAPSVTYTQLEDEQQC